VVFLGRKSIRERRRNRADFFRKMGELLCEGEEEQGPGKQPGRSFFVSIVTWVNGRLWESLPTCQGASEEEESRGRRDYRIGCIEWGLPKGAGGREKL